MKLLILFLGISLFIHCSSSKKIPSNTTDLEVFLSFSKGPCYGKCPVYNLTVFENGLIEFQGVQYTTRLGFFYKWMDKKQFQDWEERLSELEWQDYDTYYPNPVSDFPVHKLSFREHEIAGNQILPLEVQEIFQSLDSIADESNWKPKVLKSEL